MKKINYKSVYKMLQNKIYTPFKFRNVDKILYITNNIGRDLMYIDLNKNVIQYPERLGFYGNDIITLDKNGIETRLWYELMTFNFNSLEDIEQMIDKMYIMYKNTKINYELLQIEEDF